MPRRIVIDNIPDADFARIVAALAAARGYSATVPAPPGQGQAGPGRPPVPNPETREQFAVRMLWEHALHVAGREEVRAARGASESAARQKADADRAALRSRVTLRVEGTP